MTVTAPVAISDEHAARIAGITMRQLRYWDRTGLVTPSLRRRFTPRNTVRLYSFTDTLQLLAAAGLRRQGISLQHIRRIVSYLRGEGYAEPLHELAFVIVGQEIYFQHRDGTWEGELSRRQTVIHQVLELDALRAEVNAALRRPENAAGKVDRKRGRLGNKPVFAGTRVPVEAVVRYLRRGYEPVEVLAAYPVLTPADIEVARRELRSA